MMRRITIAAAAAAALIFPFAAAPAAISQRDDADLVVTGDPYRETRRIAVSVADLNLRADRSVKIADSRVRRAARKVCGYNIGAGLGQAVGYMDCYQSAFGAARVGLNSRIYSARAG